MFEVFYQNKKREDVTLTFDTLDDAIDASKQSLRWNDGYVTHRPMRHIYEENRMVAVVEGRVNSAGQIRQARVQRFGGDWSPWRPI